MKRGVQPESPISHKAWISAEPGLQVPPASSWNAYFLRPNFPRTSLQTYLSCDS